jgi:hypothetical protein
VPSGREPHDLVVFPTITCGLLRRRPAQPKSGLVASNSTPPLPLPHCGLPRRRCPADLVEGAVLGRIALAALPTEVVELARVELRRRLETPEMATTGRQRERLITWLERLKSQHGWGDLTDAEHQTERDATRAALADLPDGDRIKAFDAYRTRILALPDAIRAASPARLEELCRIVIQQVVVVDRGLRTIEWVPAARPFFEKQRECPQGDSNP